MASLKTVSNRVNGVHKRIAHSQKANAERGVSRTVWQWAFSASLVPWLSVGASKAVDLMDAGSGAEMAAEATGIEAADIGAVLAGDVAMLIVAPLLVYAAVKYFWKDQDEQISNQIDDQEPLDPLLSASVRSVVTGSSCPSRQFSRLYDPELQALATTATQGITGAISDAKKSCAFQAGLHELAVKHGGAKEDSGWISEFLKNSSSDNGDKNDLEMQNLAAHASGVSNQELCDILVIGIAQHAALQELKALVEGLKRKQNAVVNIL